jgi:hypothetical protein
MPECFYPASRWSAAYDSGWEHAGMTESQNTPDRHAGVFLSGIQVVRRLRFRLGARRNDGITKHAGMTESQNTPDRHAGVFLSGIQVERRLRFRLGARRNDGITKHAGPSYRSVFIRHPVRGGSFQRLCRPEYRLRMGDLRFQDREKARRPFAEVPQEQ